MLRPEPLTMSCGHNRTPIGPANSRYPGAMRVSKDRIEELRRLYKDAYGQDLSEQEARDMVGRTVELYDTLMERNNSL